MITHSRIKELATQIQSDSTELDKGLSLLGLQSPTFSISMVDELPPELHAAQRSLLAATDELSLLIRGPLQTLMYLASYSHNERSSLHAIVRFDIAKRVPLNGTIAFDDIAHSCSLERGDTTRILRHAMTFRIFCEPRIGVVGHTASSRLLAQDATLRNFISSSLDEIMPAACHMVDALERWPGSQEPSESGWNIAHNEPQPLFATIEKYPTRAEKFADSMTWLQSRPGLAIHHLIDERSLKWEEVNKVVDIGGSRGTVCMRLIDKYPSIQCVVQDLPEVINTVRTSFCLNDRITFMGHDFFKEQPVKDADVYLLRWILHDWSNKYAVEILKALVPALALGSKLIINEMCLPEPGTVSLYEQRFLRSTDLVMKQIQNGKERDLEDWKNLLEAADSRLRLLDVKQPEGSELSILTVVVD